MQETGPQFLDAPMEQEGIPRIVEGVNQQWNAPTLERKAHGASEAQRGAMHTLKPLLLPALLTNPIGTLTGLAAGSVAGMAAEGGLKAVGVPEGYAEVGGNLAGLGAGYGAGKVAEGVPARTRSLVKGFGAAEPWESAVESLKPRTNLRKWVESWQRSQPEVIKVADRAGKPVESIDDYIEAAKVAKRDVREQYDARVGPSRSDQVDLTPGVKAMIATIPETLQRENPAAYDALVKKYSQRRLIVPLETAERFLVEANNELQAWHSKFPHVKSAELIGDPQAAADLAWGNSLRDIIYGHLEKAAPDNATRDLARTYGSLIEIVSSAEKREPVAARQNPRGLGEKFGLISAVGPAVKGVFSKNPLTSGGEIATALLRYKGGKWLDEQNRSDALMAKAFRDFDPVKHATVPEPQPPGKDSSLAEDLRYAAAEAKKNPQPKTEEPRNPFFKGAVEPQFKGGESPVRPQPGPLNLLNEVEAARSIDIGNPDVQAAQNLQRLKMLQRGGQPAPPQAAPGGRAQTPPRPPAQSGADIVPRGDVEQPPISVRPVPPGVPVPAPGMGPRQGPVPQVPPGAVSSEGITPRGDFEEGAAPRQPRRSAPPRSSSPAPRPGPPRQGGPIGQLTPSALQQLLDQMGISQPYGIA